MGTHLRRWLRPPVFDEDAARTRTAELLHVLSLSSLFLTGAIGIVGPFVFANPLVTTSIVWGLALFAMLAQVLMRRGHVRAASYLFLGVFWVLITLVVLFSGSVKVTMSSFFVTITVISGLLLGVREGLSMVALNVLVTLGLLYLSKIERMPPVFFRAPLTAAGIELVANLILTGVAVALTLRSLTTALSRAHESEHAAADQATEMREINVRLAREIAEREEAQLEREEAKADRERLLVEQAALQQQVIEAQQQALRELSTPIIPVMEGIIIMPLIGGIDSARAQEIMRAVLTGISEHQASVVILDVTGVSLIDTGIVNNLNKTILAARLKGARTIVTGISDAVAEAVVDLGIDWGTVETLRDLQTGLRVALGQLGKKLM